VLEEGEEVSAVTGVMEGRALTVSLFFLGMVTLASLAIAATLVAQIGTELAPFVRVAIVKFLGFTLLKTFATTAQSIKQLTPTVEMAVAEAAGVKAGDLKAATLLDQGVLPEQQETQTLETGVQEVQEAQEVIGEPMETVVQREKRELTEITLQVAQGPEVEEVVLRVTIL
jgi:hypothetical protein